MAQHEQHDEHREEPKNQGSAEHSREIVRPRVLGVQRADLPTERARLTGARAVNCWLLASNAAQDLVTLTHDTSVNRSIDHVCVFGHASDHAAQRSVVTGGF